MEGAAFHSCSFFHAQAENKEQHKRSLPSWTGCCPRLHIALCKDTWERKKKQKETHTWLLHVLRLYWWLTWCISATRSISQGERERDECEQRQQTLLTGNERVREVRSHHPRLSHSVTSLLFWRLLEVYFLPLVQLTVSPVYNMLGIFQRAEQCCVQV